MESRSTYVTWLLAAIVVCSGGQPGIAQRRQEPAATRPAKASILAAAVYTADQGPRQLTLWDRDLAPRLRCRVVFDVERPTGRTFAQNDGKQPARRGGDDSRTAPGR